MIQRTQAKGFTIVELLIVVVVIAILASITIISYNGIQNRAKTSASLSTVATIRDKAAAWDTLLGSYPNLAQLRTNSLDPPNIDTAGGGAGPTEAKLSTPDSAIGAELNAIRANNGSTVFYAPCWNGTRLSGGTITYLDYVKGENVNVTIGTC